VNRQTAFILPPDSTPSMCGSTKGTAALGTENRAHLAASTFSGTGKQMEYELFFVSIGDRAIRRLDLEKEGTRRLRRIRLALNRQRSQESPAARCVKCLLQ